MRKSLLFILVLFCALSLAIAACSSPDDEDYDEYNEETVADESSMLMIEAYAFLTAGQFADAIETFYAYTAQGGEQVLLRNIGLGKAYFGIGDYISSIAAFETAVRNEPDRTDILHYLGEAQMRAGLYSDSTETFRRLTEKYTDNQLVFYKLEQSLISDQNHMGLHRFYEERIEFYGIDDEDAVTYAVRMFKTALLMHDEDLIASALEKFRGTSTGTAFELGYRIYQSVMSGDDEAVNTLVRDLDNVIALRETFAWDGLYIGEYDEYGKYEGRGFIVFAHGTVPRISQFYFGEFLNGKPNGIGLGISGGTRDLGAGTTETSFNIIESNWIDGIPDGDVVITNNNVTYNEGEVEWVHTTITTAFYANGMAQGEVWTRELWYSDGNENISYIKHLVEDGIPIPFEVRGRQGTRRHTVYKARFDAPDSSRRANAIQTDPCDCVFIFD